MLVSRKTVKTCEMARSTLKMALIGCGGIAEAHWKGIQRIAKRVDVTAVVDTDPSALKAMADRTGAVPYTDIDRALKRGDFDAVDIMLPHALHEYAAMAAFRAGKHVLLEKPIAHTLDSAERILQVSREIRTVFMVAEQSQYWPDVIAARKLIDEGAIGVVISASGNFYDRVSVESNASRPWRYDLSTAGGGVSMDGGAHWIRPLRMMMGEIAEVVGVAGTHVPKMECESWSRMLMKFESGSIGVLTCQNYLHFAGPVELFRAQLRANFITGGRESTLILYNSAFLEEKPHERVEGRRTHGDEIRNFCEVVLDGASMAATPDFALGELRTALALYASIRSGRWEKVW